MGIIFDELGMLSWATSSFLCLASGVAAVILVAICGRLSHELIWLLELWRGFIVWFNHHFIDIDCDFVVVRLFFFLVWIHQKFIAEKIFELASSLANAKPLDGRELFGFAKFCGSLLLSDVCLRIWIHVQWNHIAKIICFIIILITMSKAKTKTSLFWVVNDWALLLPA